ncbi:MAG: hypothetical protein ACREF5_03385 [Candidatus Saccharimonadales bacterium]
MKQKDVALIILIAGISGVISFVVSNFIFASPANSQQKVAVVDPISTEFTTPNTQFFNNQSIDPTQLIEVQNSNNSNPFDGSGQ